MLEIKARQKHMREDEMRIELMCWTRDRGNGKIIDNFVVVAVVGDGGDAPLKCDVCLLDILYKETQFIFFIVYERHQYALANNRHEKGRDGRVNIKTKIE